MNNTSTDDEREALLAEADALVASWGQKGSWSSDSPVGMVMRLAAALRRTEVPEPSVDLDITLNTMLIEDVKPMYSQPQGEPSVNRVWPATLVGAVESEDAQTIQKLRDQIDKARTAWWSATEDNGLVYTDKIEDAMNKIWLAIGDADWTPGTAGGAR